MTVPDLSAEPAALGLALRHRPRTFAGVVGQRHVSAVLRRALSLNRVPRQLLFSGGSGLGKTTLARVVAAALLCENPHDGDACGTCESCLDITTQGRIHPDVIEFDAASHGLKEQVRELAARAATAPIRGKYRVYIIDEAHGLSQGGGQAFLKLLEEPPAHVVFMLATTDPDKMLRTNRGRCIEFELVRPSDDEIAAHLVAVAAIEGWTLSDSVARSVIAATDPALGVRGCLMTLEKLADTLAWGSEPTDAELATLLGIAPQVGMAALCDAILAGDRKAALTQLENLRRSVADQAVRRSLIDWARRRLMGALSGELAESPDLALWRYETLTACEPGPLWTEICLCKLAQPELDPQPATLRAHLAEASAALAALKAASSDAREAAPVKASPPAAPAPRTPSPQAPAEGPSAAAPPAAPARPAVPATSPPARRTEPASPTAPRRRDPSGQTTRPPRRPGDQTATVSTPAVSGEQFVAALAKRSKKAAALANAATISIEGATVTVAGVTGLHSRMTALRDHFTAAAADCNLTVQLVETSRPRR